jgi:hypothetical protein
MKIFSQQDPRWKDKKLGLDTSDLTIGQAGCFLTCFSMLVEVDPAAFNERMKIYGGFDPKQPALICPGIVPNAYKKVYFEDQIWCSKSAAPMDVIDSALANGKAVIVQLDTSPAEGIQSHFVILTKKISANDYEMIDPWPLVDVPRGTVITRYGKDKNGQPRKIKEVICYVAVMGGVDMSSVDALPPATTEQPTVTDSAELGDSITTLYGNSRLRTAPGLNAPIVCKLPIGLEINRNPEIEVIKDGYRWIHLDLWMAAESVDGKNKFVK